MEAGHVKRVFSIQEERQSQYQALRKVQAQYASRECSTQYYNQAMSRVTTAFQALSQEVLQLIATFREGGLPETVRILEALQRQEKEKLDLTVKWQVLTQRERVAQGASGSDDRGQSGASDDSSGMDQEEKSRLRRRLAEVEGTIADLLEDFKFECEPILMSQFKSQK